MPRKEVVVYQLRLDGPPAPRSRFVWERGELALLREQTKVARCGHCEKVIAGRKIHELAIYQPFSDTPSIYPYCEPCCDRGYDQSDSVFWCEGCGRDVWDSNGHRMNMKWIGSTPICVRCFQQDMLDRGHSDDVIDPPPYETFTIPCDWYDHAELRAKGWVESETFSGDILERSNGKEWRDYCREIKAKGGLVLTDQGRTSIVGGPDYVTVWVKYPSHMENVA